MRRVLNAVIHGLVCNCDINVTGYGIPAVKVSVITREV